MAILTQEFNLCYGILWERKFIAELFTKHDQTLWNYIH